MPVPHLPHLAHLRTFGNLAHLADLAHLMRTLRAHVRSSMFTLRLLEEDASDGSWVQRSAPYRPPARRQCEHTCPWVQRSASYR